jgi:tRNA dimethylallyltransferase
MKPKIIVIVGPTASGKTKVSIDLAKKINGEIISADSMQIYKDMTIGTAKPTIAEMQGIKHYMIDIISPSESFNIAKYKELAENAIKEILSEGKIPIIIGGTGLYINTLINGVEFADIESDVEYRNNLIKYAEENGAYALHSKLEEIDKEAADRIDINNIRRVARALEIYHVTGKTKTELDKESIKELKYDYRVYGIQISRDELYNRINLRVEKMLEQGLVDEVRNLVQKYNVSNTAMQGLGYKEVVKYLNNEISYEDMVELLKMETRRYAKRQLTWFRRDKRINWVSSDNAVEKIIVDLNS